MWLLARRSSRSTSRTSTAPRPARGGSARRWRLSPATTCTCSTRRKANTTTQVNDSSFLGSRLVGGQLNSDDAIELSYPFPRPGANAVFEVRKGRAKQFHSTSPVTRVVMRLSIVTVTRTRVIPTWEEISRAIHPDDP